MDWIEKWKTRQEQMPYHADILKDHEESFWSAFAPYYDEMHCLEFSRATAERLDPYLRDVASLLEIGAGTGALTLPLAAKVARLTALDASPHMLRVLERKLADQGITNVHPVLSPWESTVVERHDLVLASGCTYAFHEIDKVVEKMASTARKLIAFSGDLNRREPETLSSLRKQFCWELPDGGKEPILYNVLYQMGFNPDVLVIRDIRHDLRFADRAAALERLSAMFRLSVTRRAELATSLAPLENPQTGEVVLGEASLNGLVMVCPL